MKVPNANWPFLVRANGRDQGLFIYEHDALKFIEVKKGETREVHFVLIVHTSRK